MRGEFYKMEYEAWDEGTDTLTLEQEGAYLRFCHQMYRRKSPVVDDKMVLARLWKCHPNKSSKLRDDLIAAGKIVPTGDGHLTNTRVTQELDTRKTQSTHRSDAGRTGGIRSGEIRRNALKNNDASEALASSKTNQRREEEKREDISSETSSLRDAREPQNAEADHGKAKGRKRGTRLPSDWWPDDDLKAYARERLPSNRACQEETERFKDWAASSPNAVKLDWAAAYRNWIRNNAPTSDADMSRPGFVGAITHVDTRPGPTGARDAPRRPSSDDRLVAGLRTVMELFPDEQ